MTRLFAALCLLALPALAQPKASLVTAPTCAATVAQEAKPKRQRVIDRLRAELAKGRPYLTKGAIADAERVDPGSVLRWATADLLPGELAEWKAGADRIKPKTRKARKPGKQAAVIGEIRALLALPEAERPLLSVIKLSADHRVTEGSVLRWVRRHLNAEEQAAWKESQKRRPPRLDYRKDTELGARKRAEVLALVRATMRDAENGYLSKPAIAEQCGVAPDSVAEWLDEDLTDDEMVEWVRRRERRRIEGANAAKARVLAARIEELELDVGTEVAREIDRPSPKLRTNVELAEKYGVTTRAISRRLQSALPEEHVEWRERQLQRQGQLNSVADLSLEKERRIRLVHQRLLTEKQEIADGQREFFSSNDELGEMFDCSATAIDRAIRQIPEELQVERVRVAYRRGHAKRTIPFVERRRQMGEYIALEMQEFTDGRRKILSTNGEVTARFGIVSRGVASVVANAVLPQEVAQLRSRQLRLQGRPEHRELEERLLELVREEVAEARRTPTALCSTTEELARMFGVVEQTAARWVLNGLPAEDRAIRSARIALERSRRSHEQRRTTGGTLVEGVAYDSMMEAATADLLKTYVSGFVPEDGRNVHVQVGRLEYDFVVGNFVVEFHPIVPLFPGGDFETAEEYAEYLEERDSLPAEERGALLDRTKAWLLDRYHEGRANNPALATAGTLVVLGSVDDVHAFLSREDVSKSRPLPPLAELRSAFRAFLRKLRDARATAED